MITLAVFTFFAVLAVAGAVLVIVQKNVMHSVLYLAFTVLATAGVFFTLQAEYLGAIQILVYGGGIVVLYIFVIIIVNLKEVVPERRSLLPKLVLIAVPVAVGAEVAYLLLAKGFPTSGAGPAKGWGSRPWRRLCSVPISFPSSWPPSCSWPCSSGPSSSPGESSSMIPIEAVIVLGLLLFAIGFVGVVVRKNLVVMLMSLELLLNGANVILVGLGRRLGSPRGTIFAMFVIIMAVSEAAVGFALVLAYFRQKKSYDVDALDDLKG